jgi:CheY-like chemotaxis protein
MEGHSCIAVRSAAEALQTITRRPIHLAFVDVKLPDMEGLELVERIRQMSPTLPCVLVSGFFYSDDGPIQDKLARGLVVGFISKPFMLEEIEEAIRVIVHAPSQKHEQARVVSTPPKREINTTPVVAVPPSREGKR